MRSALRSRLHDSLRVSERCGSSLSDLFANHVGLAGCDQQAHAIMTAQKAIAPPKIQYQFSNSQFMCILHARRRRSALLTTETELSDIAAAAMSGESKMPKDG